MKEALQDRFLDSRGAPVKVGDLLVFQIDKIYIPERARVTIQFIGEKIFYNSAAVIAIPSPGRILLSDGSAVSAVKTWDEEGLPREVSYVVESAGRKLQIYNKYRTKHKNDILTEDSFTGNSGMVIEEVGSDKKRYKCSNGPGEFSPDALIFDVSWNAID